MKNMKNCPTVDLIAQQKHPVALNAIQKSPALFKVQFLKNQEKPHKIPIINQNGKKMEIFGGFS